MKQEYEQKIAELQSKSEIVINQIKKQTKEDIKDSCSEIVTTAKEEIQKAIDESTSDLHEATETVRNNSTKNTLLNFVCAIVLCVAAICGVTYAQNYRDGKAIAEAKAVEALAAERAKFEEEIKTAKANMETELYSQRIKLQNDAVLEYKKSSQFTEDSCKNVAENILLLKYINYINTYIRSDDIKRNLALQAFYRDYIKIGAEKYNKKRK